MHLSAAIPGVQKATAVPPPTSIICNNYNQKICYQVYPMQMEILPEIALRGDQNALLSDQKNPPPRVDSSVPLKHHDLRDPGLICL